MAVIARGVIAATLVVLIPIEAHAGLGKIIENGRIVGTYRDDGDVETLPSIVGKLPRLDLATTTKGGFFLGWYYKSKNASLLDAMDKHEKMLALAVQIAGHECDLKILTDAKHIAERLEHETTKVRDKLDRLKAEIAVRDHLEAINKLERDIELDVAKARHKIHKERIGKTNFQLIYECILSCDKERARIASDSGLSPESRALLIYQLESTRDKDIMELGGSPPPRSAPPPPPATAPRESSAPNKTEAVKRRQARCEVDVGTIMSNPMLDDSEKRAHVRTLRAECEDDCRRIMDG